MKVKCVGKIKVCGGTVIKEYFQGSTWKRMGTDVLLLQEEGFDKIILRINSNHPNRKDMLHVIEAILRLFSNVTIEEITQL